MDVVVKRALVVAVLALVACTPPPPPPDCPNDLPSACPSPPPSYTNDVAPIVQQRCLPCHGPGGVSSDRHLGTQADLQALQSSVLNQVYACKMPQPDAGYTLSEDERQKLLGWLVCGAPNN